MGILPSVLQMLWYLSWFDGKSLIAVKSRCGSVDGFPNPAMRELGTVDYQDLREGKFQGCPLRD